MSNLSDLLAPAAPPTATERPSPKSADDTRQGARDDGPRFADELERERAAERAADKNRAAERAADRDRAADQNRAAEQSAERDRAAEQTADRDRAAERAAEKDRVAEQANRHDQAQDQAVAEDSATDTNRTEAPAANAVRDTDVGDEPTPDLVQTSAPTEPVVIEPATDGIAETPVVVPQPSQIAGEQPAPEEDAPISLLDNTDQTLADPEAMPDFTPGASEQVETGDEPESDVLTDNIGSLTDETTIVTSEPATTPAPDEIQAQTAEVIKVTALSGETVPLTPPPAPINAPAEPGALGRWFAQAAGPIALGESTLQSGGLLNKLAAQTSPQALNGGQPVPQEGDLAAFSQNAAQSTPAPDMTFADAMATSSMDSESLDALVTQAMAKANAALEPGTQTAPTVTTGQTVATGAQAAMTAVPQAATGQAVPVTALAVEITRQAANGKTQFDIRLDPPELGRLNVRLEMDASGQTRTHLVVERAETLDMLSSDVRSLERALQQAGLKSEPGSVSFELAQDTADGFDQGSQSTGTDDHGDGQSAEAPSSDAAVDGELSDNPLEAITSPEAIRHQIAVTGHLDVHV